MKTFVNIGVIFVATICVCVAAYLAINGKDGWGWFLFVGLVCAGAEILRNE